MILARFFRRFASHPDVIISFFPRKLLIVVISPDCVEESNRCELHPSMSAANLLVHVAFTLSPRCNVIQLR
jgi:hypothetical protein